MHDVATFIGWPTPLWHLGTPEKHCGGLLVVDLTSLPEGPLATGEDGREPTVATMRCNRCHKTYPWRDAMTGCLMVAAERTRGSRWGHVDD